jgi:hypothetical protein
MLESLLYLVVVLLVLGLILFVIMRLPFIDETMKGIIKTIFLCIVGIVIIFFLVDLIHGLGFATERYHHHIWS